MQDALRNIPKPSMLVIEDIDSLFNEKRKAENPSMLTFSGLLNSLDGLVAADGILTVMTTNHIEKLDPALIRAGRVDRKFEFKPPAHGQIKALFLSFYPAPGTRLRLSLRMRCSNGRRRIRGALLRCKSTSFSREERVRGRASMPLTTSLPCFIRIAWKRMGMPCLCRNLDILVLMVDLPVTLDQLRVIFTLTF